MRNIIEIEHLSKSFGDVKAVQDISFCVKEGELFAFLGVNGAGKSTTISIICGQLKKDAGIYISTGYSAYDCICFIRALLKKYDLDIAEDFVYSARPTKQNSNQEEDA